MPQEASPRIAELFAAALRLHQTGRLDEAERLYGQVLQLDARHPDALHLLGVLAHQRGRNEAAVELIRKAIAQNSQVAAFHNNLGNAFNSLSRFEEAAASYAQAVSLKPDLVGAHYNIGVARQAQGRFNEAVTAYGRALALKPDLVEALGNLGNTLQAQGKLAEAVVAYQKALALRPSYAEVHSNLGNVRMAQRQWPQAQASLAQALRHKPDFAEAHNNLGLVYSEQGKMQEAAACFERALHLKPDYAEAQLYLGNALKELGRPEEAMVCYRRALAINADFAAARLGLATAVIPQFAVDADASVQTLDKFSQALDELTAWSRSHLAALGKAVGSHQPFYLAYRPQDVSALLSRYGDLICHAAAAHWYEPLQALRNAPPTRQRIRMVVVSGQVRRHPVWDVILRGIIAHLDRERFEIYLYHTDAVVDEETAWAESRVERFIQGPKSTLLWMDHIAQDRPDVIFYPEVGMDPVSCALAAMRLAPLQVAGWGHPVTTGLASINVFLSAELLEGPSAERHYRERLIRVSGTGVCTEPNAVQARRWDGPDRPQHTVRFALCQQPIKFDPADDALLARIAKDAGPSEFWLASSRTHPWATVQLRERLAAAFRAQGLDPDAYLRVMPWLPREEFMGFLDEMDIYLDCPAFSGYTTAWQAIHRGLPIVTCEGEFLRQRLAAGLLRQVGLIEGIATSREQYVQTAIRWARAWREQDGWALRREELRRAAPKADGNRMAIRDFERILSEALRGSEG